MYTAIIILLIATGAFLLYKGLLQKSRTKLAGGIVLLLFTFTFFNFLEFWGEKLWFDAVSYPQVFRTIILAEVFCSLISAIAGWMILSFSTRSIKKNNKWLWWITSGFAALFSAMWGYTQWEIILKFLNRVNMDLKDPILGMDAGFYLFTLPFLDQLIVLLTVLSVLILLSSIVSAGIKDNWWEQKRFDFAKNLYAFTPDNKFFFFASALLLFILGVGKYIQRYHLMYSDWGVVNGPGWTDVHIRLPALTFVSVFTFLMGLILLIPSARNRISRLFSKDPRKELVLSVGPTAIAVILVWFLFLNFIPGLLQWLRVEPNEISLEKPFIAHNIQFTKTGFGLDKAEEREFPVGNTFDQTTVENNTGTFKNIRLWDWRALDAVYRQFQEIRLYYEFVDVDIDRYNIGGDYRQVMVSAREMNIKNLPSQSQTFVNSRFKYTHGNGITMATVSEFTPEGLPNLLIKNIPPVSMHRDLKVDRPGIYYGELNNTPVVANSKEAEFDYPKGDENVYVRYAGKGGVQLSNWWRKFLYGWMFDGTSFLLSGYITPESRLLFHRNIIERAGRIAPFLDFDEDPYIVLNNGKLYWILDGFTTSKYFPYSEPYRSSEKIEYKDQGRTDVIQRSNVPYLNGVNYIRNSVKVVIDAYDGSVDYYAFDQEDPVLKVWSKIFPGLIKDKSEMPSGLFSHVRYPSDMLLVQGLMYSKYHMNDPEVFYNQEDLWVRATEKYYGSIEPVEPYYVMWEQPGKERPEFVLMLPFTPKSKQVMIGWIAGMCDSSNYGRFLAYMFPKEKRILGPQQIETKIDQDRFLSGQLTLWDQRGSRVIRGNVLAIPVSQTIIYVEPIYLQSETAAYPELRLVAVMHGDRLSYAETFDKALAGLYSTEDTSQVKKGAPSMQQVEPDQLRMAKKAFDDYIRLTGEGKFKEASEALSRLENALNSASAKKE